MICGCCRSYYCKGCRRGQSHAIFISGDFFLLYDCLRCVNARFQDSSAKELRPKPSLRLASRCLLDVGREHGGGGSVEVGVKEIRIDSTRQV